jgi:hypothetical protein
MHINMHTHIIRSYMCMYIYMHIHTRSCARVVCTRHVYTLWQIIEEIFTHEHAAHLYVYMSVCVCVCVCEWSSVCVYVSCVCMRESEVVCMCMCERVHI